MHPGVNKKADVMDNIQDIWLCTCYWSACYWGSYYWSSNNTGWWSGPSLTASSIWLCIQLPSPWNTIAMIVQPHDGWLMRGTIEVCIPPAVTSLRSRVIQIRLFLDFHHFTWLKRCFYMSRFRKYMNVPPCFCQKRENLLQR